MMKTAKMPRNSQKRPRLPATHPKRGKAHSVHQTASEPKLMAARRVAKSKPANVPHVPILPSHAVTNGLKKIVRLPVSEPRPADFPVGSLESRAAVRILLEQKRDEGWHTTTRDGIFRAVADGQIILQYELDPPSPEVVVPNAPAHWQGCGCQDCRSMNLAQQPEKPQLAPPVEPNRETPEDVYSEAQRRANVLRAFQDVARAGARESPPAPQWAQR